MTEDLSTLPPLHPTRVTNAIEALSHRADAASPAQYDRPYELACLETAVAALKQIARTQKAIGITADVADMGSSLLQAAGSFTRLLRKRK